MLSGPVGHELVTLSGFNLVKQAALVRAGRGPLAFRSVCYAASLDVSELKADRRRNRVAGELNTAAISQVNVNAGRQIGGEIADVAAITANTGTAACDGIQFVNFVVAAAAKRCTTLLDKVAVYLLIAVSNSVVSCCLKANRLPDVDRGASLQIGVAA